MTLDLEWPNLAWHRRKRLLGSTWASTGLPGQTFSL